MQLGGSNVDWMTTAAGVAADFGYDEININVGCPSDRVQSGQFGACLMATPDVVADCIASMQQVVDVPVTVKTRIGIDDRDDYEFLRHFVDTVVAAGCRKLIVHARVAILEGLSPRENRSVPPLRYERVFRLKHDYPEVDVILNGGVNTLDQVVTLLTRVEGIMIGRKAYQNPYFLAEIEHHLDPAWAPPARRDVVAAMIPYIRNRLAEGERLGRITRHMLGLFAGQPGARAWRRYLSEHAFREGAGIDVVEAALDALPIAA